MRKLAIALAISLLPIFAVPANAGVYHCSKRQYQSYTKSGIKYRYKTICTYSSSGSSKGNRGED